jgi:hypothetical protein
MEAPQGVDISRVYYPIDEDNFSVIIPLDQGMHRIYIKRRSEDAIADFPRTKEYFQSLLDKYGLEQFRIRNITWISQVAFYYRLASSFRSGRVFLCGDAAHVFPPLGGLGMNTGFQDALGIAWRIVAVTNGAISEESFDNYNEERRGIAQDLINRTVSTARLISRIDKNIDGSVQAWVPKMSNRVNIAQNFPLAYSGLAQTYSGFKCNGNFVGKLIPYFELWDGKNKKLSYNYIDAANFVIFAAPDALAGTLEAAKNTKNVRVIECPPHQLSGSKGTQISFEGALLMRPDGVVCAQVSTANLVEIENALASCLFIPIEK